MYIINDDSIDDNNDNYSDLENIIVHSLKDITLSFL